MRRAALIACVVLILVVVSSAVVTPARSATEVVQAVTKPVYVLTLSPASATNAVGTIHELTATLTKDGVAFGGQTVSWSKGGVGNWVGIPDARTDLNGQAHATIISIMPGSTIVAVSTKVSTDGKTETLIAQATELWTAPPEPVYVLTLLPASAENVVGTTHQLTATLTKDGVAFSGQIVSWSLSGVGQFVAGKKDTSTDSSGHAYATITSSKEGTTTVIVSAKISTCGVCGKTETLSAQATKVWTAPPEPVYVLTLLPASAENVVGTTHKLTATLTKHGVPFGGQTVSWSLSGVGSWVGTPEAKTDSHDQAHATITSSKTGTTVVTVSTEVSTNGVYGLCATCGGYGKIETLSAQATKVWTAPPQPVYVLTLLPASASNAVGTTHKLTATLTKHGVPFPYQIVSWSLSGVGSWVGTPDAKTDSSGQAHATITSSKTGTTVVTVSIMVDTSGVCAISGVSGVCATCGVSGVCATCGVSGVCATCGVCGKIETLSAQATKIWQDPSGTGVVPGVLPGDPTCAATGSCGFHSIEFFPATSGTKTDNGGMSITVTVNGTSINWTSTQPVCSVIVKGVDSANVYTYSPNQTSDTGLHAPPNNHDDIPHPSYIIFCYDCPTPPVPEASTIVLMSLGLLAIAMAGGFVWYRGRYRKSAA